MMVLFQRRNFMLDSTPGTQAAEAQHHFEYGADTKLQPA